jgi:hypothetical protein
LKKEREKKKRNRDRERERERERMLPQSGCDGDVCILEFGNLEKCCKGFYS